MYHDLCMDTQNQQTPQPTDDPSLLRDSSSSGAMTPDSLHVSKPQHKLSKKKIIIVLVFLFVIVCFALYWFAVPQNIITVAGISNKTDADILQIVKKDYPGVASLNVTKKTTQYNERCIYNSIPHLGCNVFEIDSYDYEGIFYPVGAKFNMTFKVSLSNNENDIFLGDYQGAIDGQMWGNKTKMSSNKWDSFVKLYNDLGHTTLYAIRNYDLYGSSIDGESSAIAGYKYKNLYTVCDKEDNGYCVAHNHSPGKIYTPTKQSTKNSVYVIYYNEAKNEWLVLSDDGRYFTTWVWYQMDTLDRFFNNAQFEGINWSQSPIKPYIP